MTHANAEAVIPPREWLAARPGISITTSLTVNDPPLILVNVKALFQGQQVWFTNRTLPLTASMHELRDLYDELTREAHVQLEGHQPVPASPGLVLASKIGSLAYRNDECWIKVGPGAGDWARAPSDEYSYQAMLELRDEVTRLRTTLREVLAEVEGYARDYHHVVSPERRAQWMAIATRGLDGE